MGAAPDIPPGTYGGQETVTLTAANLPVHDHALNASSQTGTTTTFTNVILAAAGTGPNTPSAPAVYGPPSASTAPLASTSIVPGDVAQGHDNMQPYLGLNYLIALNGVYPSRP